MSPPISIAYCGPAPQLDTLMRHWNLDPWLIGVLLMAAVMAGFAPGWASSRRLAGLAAVGVLAVAFVSPLCALTTALFAARAVHHLLIFAVAAPLMALALPLRAGVPAAAVFVLSTAALWAWHVPLVYDVALADTGAYWLLQTLLLAGGWLFWAHVMGRDASPLSGLPMIALGAGQMGLLSAALTFAPRPLYLAHLATTAPFGLTPLEDQQLAGLVMWVPGTVVFLAMALWLGRRHWARLEPRAS